MLPEDCIMDQCDMLRLGRFLRYGRCLVFKHSKARHTPSVIDPQREREP
jgi:hypothetical protein